MKSTDQNESKVNPQNIKTRPNQQSAITEGTAQVATVMREFAAEYGRGVRQENVRSKAKELTGTLACALSILSMSLTNQEEVEEV